MTALDTLAEDTKRGTLPTFNGADCGDEGSQNAPIVALGDTLNLDTLSTARGLLPESWEAADYRLPILGHGPIRSVAVRIEITGRRAQFRNADGSAWLKCRIVFVGDCEPDTYGKGWVRLW